MAKNDEAKNAEAQNRNVQDGEAQANREGEAEAAREGESALAYADTNQAVESEVNRMSPEEESERQRAENFPLVGSVTTFAGQHEEGPEEARVGYASTHRAEVGRVVVVHEDVIRDGEVYKAGTQDLPLEVADAMIAEGEAYEPAGKKKGR